MEVGCSIFGQTSVLALTSHNPLSRGRCWLGPKMCALVSQGQGGWWCQGLPYCMGKICVYRFCGCNHVSGGERERDGGGGGGGRERGNEREMDGGEGGRVRERERERGTWDHSFTPHSPPYSASLAELASSDRRWYGAMDSSGWLELVRSCLQSAKEVALLICVRKRCVMIHGK